MFEKFTVYAKRAVMVSEEETMTLGLEHIGTEHMLLGLIGVPQGLAGQILSEHGVTLARAREQLRHGTGDSSKATEALASIGIDIDEVRRRMDDTFGPGRFRYPRPVFAPDARKMLEQTVQEATALGQLDSIGTEHMLLGVLHDEDNAGVQLLVALGLAPATLRAEVLSRIA